LTDGITLATPEAIQVPTTEDVFLSPAVKLAEPGGRWSRQPAEFVTDLSGRDLGQGLLANQPQDRHAVYISSFEDVELFGHHHLHAVIGKGNRFDCQDVAGYQRRLQYHVDHHPGRNLPMPQITRDGDRYLIDRSYLPENGIKHIDGDVFFGTPIEPLNWGMWLLQAIPSASFFVENKPADKFLAYVGREWQKALLVTLGVSEDRVEHQELGHTYHCDRLTMFQYSHIELVPTPKELEIFGRLSQALAPDANSQAGRRLFLSRRSITRQSAGKYRALQNEDEVVAAAEALGFEICEPELLSIPAQIKLFGEAEIVVGLGGAAMFNVVFCKPGTRVVSIESSAAFVHGHASLFASLGHRYGFVFGSQDITDPAPVHKRWSVDLAGLTSILKSL
jgi:hypothetical protein